MVTQEKIKKILEATLKERTLTTRDLKEFGISSYDINVLLEGKKLERLRRGSYRWIDVTVLYDYGKDLIKVRRYDESATCFKTCYELNPNDSDICFQMFYRAIMSNNYEEAISYYQKMMGGLTRVEDKRDLKTCMLMLKELTNLPNEAKEQISTISYRSIISENGYNKSVEKLWADDKLRHYIYRRQYDIAYSIITNLEQKYHGLNHWKMVIKFLLHHIFAVRNIKPLEMARKKDYEGLIIHLEELVARNPKDIEMASALKLTKERLQMEKTGILPTCTFVETHNIYTALEHQSYKQAKSLCSFYEEKHFRLPNATILQLLDDMIASIEKKRSQEATIPNILLYLRKEDLSTAFGLLKMYLERIEMSKYEAVMIELIKIGYLESDAQFRKAFGLLNNQNINVAGYALFCYEALATKNYDLADSYISVLTKLRDLGHSYPMLEHIVELKEQLTKAPLIFKQANSIITESSPTVPEQITSMPSVPKKVEQKPVVVAPKDTDQDMLESKAEEIKKGNKIILLKSMPHARRKKIYTLIKRDFPNMRGYGIGKDPERKRLLLKEHSCEKINYSEVIKVAKQAYRDGDFSTSIRNYQNILVHSEKPNANIYSQIGLAYMRKFAYKKAILYLTVANEMYKEEGKARDFTDLIESLKGKTQDQEDKKPFVLFFEDDFQNDLEDYYGLEAVEEMAMLVSSGKTIEEVASTFHLNEEQICLLKLVFARNCYANEEYELGDIYVRRAEKMKNKSKLAKQLLEEIRINKKFYRNRITESSKPFVLTK